MIGKSRCRKAWLLLWLLSSSSSTAATHVHPHAHRHWISSAHGGSSVLHHRVERVGGIWELASAAKVRIHAASAIGHGPHHGIHALHHHVIAAFHLLSLESHELGLVHVSAAVHAVHETDVVHVRAGVGEGATQERWVDSA